MADSKIFKTGSTVRLRVKVSVAGTRQAVDPTDGAVLVRMDRDGTHVPNPATVAFTRLNEGMFELPLDTTGLADGTYHWLARVSSGPTAVLLCEDSFVLRAPTTHA